jgi:glutamyl-tRNA synthetase
MRLMEKVRVRFAPSPTGFLHVGNARTALFNWLFARKNKGAFVLRIEDTDIERSLEKYEKKLIEDLQWLGLDWDEGPDIGGEMGPYRQSLRIEIYKTHTQRLIKEEKAYHCFCSSEDLEKQRREAIASGKMAVYSGLCRGISPQAARHRIEEGEKAAVRLRIKDSGTLSYHDLVRGQLSFDMSLIGDPILVRSNDLPAYNYAVVIDDVLMKITHVIRGEDHISNTPRQLLIYDALSFDPPKFAHLSMVMGADNARLSKRHGATAVDQFEKDGILSSALLNYLALLGWAPPDGQEVMTEEDLMRLFSLKRVSRSSAIFDYDKLHWINRQHMKKLPAEVLAKRAYPYLEEKDILPKEMTKAHWAWLEKAVGSLIERVDRLSDLPQLMGMLFEFSSSVIEEETAAELKTECASRVIRLFHDKLAKLEEFNYEIFGAVVQEIKNESGCKGKELFHPLRIALTLKPSGLDLDKLIPLVEDGAKLNFPKPLKNCFQRASEAILLLE